MAISGAWRAAQEDSQPYASASVWGTGVNKIHRHYGNGSARGVTPDYPPADGHMPENVVGETVSYGYTQEDHGSCYGYGYETGTADRPSLGQPTRRAQTQPGWPQPGPHVAGLPGGTKLRSQEHGGLLTALSKLRSARPITQGMEAKGAAGELNDAGTSADRQLIMQTSMVQRDTMRAGSQRSGSQSEYRAPIRNRIPGMRVPIYAGGERHADMTPRQQSPGRRRVFYSRQAGTPDPTLMRVNAAYDSVPLDRQPPTTPDVGKSPGGSDTIGGYTSEDPTW